MEHRALFMEQSVVGIAHNLSTIAGMVRPAVLEPGNDMRQ
jgi:hypothetical protein